MNSLASLTDDQLLDGLRSLEGAQRSAMARILEHLGEVDSRQLHLRLGYSSLFEYCVRVLRLSEDEAYRRISVARLGRRWPEILVGIADGELSMSGVALLKQYLDDDNAVELLALARNSSKRVIEAKLAARFPAADVAGALRQMRAGNCDKLRPLSGSRFHLQLTIGSETKQKLESVLDLMSHTNPKRALEPAIVRALDLLRSALEREKRAQLKTGGRARVVRQIGPKSSSKRPSTWVQMEMPGASAAAPVPAAPVPAAPVPAAPVPAAPVPAARAIPRPLRRAVFDSEGARCSFVGQDGHVCGATAFLEIDHAEPWALGGASVAANLRVFCRAHNQLAAEGFFGRYPRSEPPYRSWRG